VSPEPYVRGQAVAVAVLLVAAAVLGSPLAMLVCSLAGGLCAWGLRARYRGDVLLARVDVPPHRERLDLIVAGDMRAALGAGLVASGLLVAFPADRPDLGIAPGTLVLLSVTATVIVLSSLVDWYVILPRVSGLLGTRPCRQPDGDHPRFPRTWRETTRWWYVHRIVAALVLRFGLSYAVVLTVAEHVSLFGGASVVAGAAVGGFAAYLAAIPQAVWQAGHPSMIVGRTVRRRSVQRTRRTVTVLGRRLPLPLPKRRAVGPPRAREYVYDVALESVQLVPAAGREGAVPRDDRGAIAYERNPTKLQVRDTGASEPEPAIEHPFSGCEDRCSGVSWYCIENPRCFAPK
jgi:hypothetical protein